jgi:D-alanyl-D-alanine carboxypeptidase
MARPPDGSGPARPYGRAMIRHRLTLLATTGAVCATVLAAAPPAPAEAHLPAGKLKRALSGLTRAGAPGAVVLVRRGTRTRYFARGYANRARRTRMRAGDRFRIGSVTKTFTATVVLQLAGEEKLSLYDTVEHWLPGLVPGGERITVRQLLNHTSGLFNYTEDAGLLQGMLRDRLHEWSPRDLVAVATAHPPSFAPGERWGYSNTGYLVLGLIAEAADGRPLGAQLEARIFTPLRLRHTSFDSAPRITGRYAHGYFGLPRGRDVSVFSPSGAWAAGAIVSTAADVGRFYRALLSGRLLRPAQLRAMRTTVPIVPGAAYGLGIARARQACGSAWVHDGDFPGYLTSAKTSADGRRQAVVLVNTDSLTERGRRALDRLTTTAYCG